jgi:hypothetical protein
VADDVVKGERLPALWRQPVQNPLQAVSGLSRQDVALGDWDDARGLLEPALERRSRALAANVRIRRAYRDAPDPGREGRLAAERVQAAEDGEEDFLDQVFQVIARSEDALDCRVDASALAQKEFSLGASISRLALLDQASIARIHAYGSDCVLNTSQAVAATLADALE